MDAVANILEWVATNIFSQVAILIGLITLLGLVLQRKPVEDVVAGTLRATIGVIILFIGIDVFVEGLVAFQTIVASAVGLEPPAATNTLGDFLGTHGGGVALVIALGFLLHLVAVRLLGTRYVYLTGHQLFWIAVIITRGAGRGVRLCWNLLLARLADRAEAEGVDLPLWTSGNVPGGDERNAVLAERYSRRVTLL